jgi:hypothetical protein
MDDSKVFDEEYVAHVQVTVVGGDVSQTKKTLKEPLSQEEIARYGIAKPRRERIRARIIRDRNS